MFLLVLYDKNAEKILSVPTDSTELIELVRAAANFHFKSAGMFMKFCNHKHPAEITSDEFYVFLKSFTRLGKTSVDKIFTEFAVNKKGGAKMGKDDISEMVIVESNLLKIYEDGNKSKSKSMSMKKSFEEEKFKSFMDMSNLNLSGFGGGKEAGRNAELEDNADMGGMQNDLYMQNDGPSEFSMEAERGQVRLKKD
jgi:hypothetical protein